MTTSSRIEHQHSIHPVYPLQDSFHPHHPFSKATSDAPHGASRDSLPPLAYLSEAAAAMASASLRNASRLEYGGPSPGANGAKRREFETGGQFTHQHPRNARIQSATSTSESNSHFHRRGGSSLGESSFSSGTSSPQDVETAMNIPSTSSVHEGVDRADARRGSMSMDHTATLTPTPSPQGRASDYADQPYQQQRYTNGHSGPHSHHPQDHHHLASPDHYQSQHKHHHAHDQEAHQHYPQKHPNPGPQHSQATPSPPLPTPDGYQGRPLPPIEPSHPLHTYMSNSRRGSLTEPEYHAAPPGGDGHRRPSSNAMDVSNGYSAGGPPGGEGRHYATTPPPSAVSSGSEPHYPPYPIPSTSPMQLRQSEHGQGRRESLPSIHSSAGPLGQLLAQEPQRRHSIAHGDHAGPLKRKTSATPLSQVHSVEMEHPAKRRDSIPDAALPYHPHHTRSSLSAPSSPPRRASIVPHNQVPTLNLQPAAEIKSSMMQNGPPMMDHGRPLFPLHQPRRPSLLSEASLSRRSSVADAHHYPSHFQQQQQQQQHASQDYDNNMNVDMERMHLSGHGSELPQGQGQGGHLYPGYPNEYLLEGAKGDTPYSRSPELRVSHKLAERKRRKEMKELFDELRDSLPVDRSLKTSKWEILTKAVDYISNMKTGQDEMTKEIGMLRQEVARLQKH